MATPATQFRSAARLGPLAAGAGIAVSAAAGFAFGPTILGGLSYFWNDLLLPTFTLIYLYGVALCT